MSTKSLFARISSALLVVLMASTLVVLDQPEAVAAARSCHGSSCTGKHPTSYGCADDAITIGRRAIYIPGDGQVGQIEQRWSRKCQAAWTRWTSWHRGYNDSFKGGVDIYAWNPGRSSQAIAGLNLGHSTTTSWTRMVDSRAHVKSCSGMHVKRYGRWKKWVFLGCW